VFANLGCDVIIYVMKDMSIVLKRAFFSVIVIVLLTGGMGCFGPGTSASEATAAEVKNGIFNLVNAERVSQGAEALTRSSALDEIATEYATSGFTQESRYETNLLYIVHNAWQLDFPGSVRLDEDTAGEQVDFCISESDMYDALLKGEAMETGVGVVIVGSTVYFTQVFDVVNTKGADGEPIVLTENPEATDPTWDDLVDFLEEDATDQIEYDRDAFICGDFAEAVHNNAEAAGIKAAFVPIRLNQEPGHAVNAFNVDGTTVFIDVINGDKVAYVEVGEDYGVIELDTAQAFTYTYFETYLVRYEAYFVDMGDYTDDLAAYNAEVVSYNAGDPVPEEYLNKAAWFQALQDEQAELSARIVVLDAEMIALGLDGTYFHPTESLDTPDPNVAGYYVHW